MNYSFVIHKSSFIFCKDSFRLFYLKKVFIFDETKLIFMIKNYFSLLFFFVGMTTMNAQTNNVMNHIQQNQLQIHSEFHPSPGIIEKQLKSEKAHSITDLVAKTSTCTDTLSYPYLKQYINNQNNLYYMPLNGSFGVTDAEFAQVYKTGATPLTITGLEFIAGKPGTMINQALNLKLTIFNVANGVPTTELTSMTYTIPATADTNLAQWYATLPTPLQVSNDFAVGIKTVSPTSDVKVYISDTDYNPTYDEQLLYLRSPSASLGFTDVKSLYLMLNNANVDFDVIIHPIISYTMGATLTAPSQACTNQSVSITGTYTPAAAATNRFLNFYAFTTYFNYQNTTDETHIVAPLGTSATLLYGANQNYTYTTAGNYTIIYEYDLGLQAVCFDQSSASIQIQSTPDASFTYTNTTFCSSSSNETPTVTEAGGTFTATPTGLSIVSTSGEIDFSNSTEGTYQVKYSKSNGSCNDEETKTITITSAIDATFNYSQSSYCVTDNNPQVTLGTGASAGLFTTNITGLSINSTTGEIDLSSSQPGTYLVTNTIQGSGICSGDDNTVEVTILPSPSIAFSTPNSICETSSAIEVIATPAGGTLSGDGVVGQNFDPSLVAPGTATITYEVTENGCVGTASTTIQVDAVPVIQISPVEALCKTDAPISLSATPAGGTFSGAGVNGTTFDPSQAIVGANEITYTATNGQCSGSESMTIVVDECLAVSEANSSMNVKVYPIPATEYLQIQSEKTVIGELFTVEGKSILTPFTINENTSFQLDVRSVSKGVYLLKLSNGQNNLTKRIIVE